jgi:hypothetical protein
MDLNFQCGTIYCSDWFNQCIYFGLDFVKKKIHNKYV